MDNLALYLWTVTIYNVQKELLSLLIGRPFLTILAEWPQLPNRAKVLHLQVGRAKLKMNSSLHTCYGSSKIISLNTNHTTRPEQLFGMVSQKLFVQ